MNWHLIINEYAQPLETENYFWFWINFIVLIIDRGLFYATLGSKLFYHKLH